MSCLRKQGHWHAHRCIKVLALKVVHAPQPLQDVPALLRQWNCGWYMSCDWTLCAHCTTCMPLTCSVRGPPCSEAGTSAAYSWWEMIPRCWNTRMVSDTSSLASCRGLWCLCSGLTAKPAGRPLSRASKASLAQAHAAVNMTDDVDRFQSEHPAYKNVQAHLRAPLWGTLPSSMPS